MDKLKSAIADKILEITSLGEDNIKAKLEKIARFRDFSDACQSLIIKYPLIETELITMVENNDFDTKIASSRVDAIIRLAENNEQAINADMTNKVLEAETDFDTSQSLPEDIEYEEVETVAQEGNDKGYVSFEEIAEDAKTETEPVIEPSAYLELDLQPEISIKPQTGRTKETAKRGLQLILVIAIIIALIFIIVFIINNTERFLWGFGIAAVIAGIIWIFVKKKNNQDAE